MKTIVLLASLGLAAVAGPYAIREFYNRYIAVDCDGIPLEHWRCPACGRRSAFQPTVGTPLHICGRCGHRWSVHPAAGFDLLAD